MKIKPGILYISLIVISIPIIWLSADNLLNNIIVLNNKEVDRNSDTVRQVIIHPYIPKKVVFAGEEVPIWIDEVRERLENELIINTHWHSNTIMMLKMAPRWFPVFESIFDTMGVPEDFKYVSLIESRLKNEVSPAGAAGFWHLMPTSAKEFDLYIDDEIDERYDVEKATYVAGEYFLKAKQKFLTWTNAAASYNRGMGGLSRAIAHQQVDNYYDLKMNSETARYVFRIIAVKLIFENPERYGFYLSESDYYKPLQTTSISVDSAVDWVEFAFEHGTIYKYVRLYNPWIQDKVMKNKKRREYSVLIPKNSQIFRDPVSNHVDTIGVEDSLSKEE